MSKEVVKKQATALTVPSTVEDIIGMPVEQVAGLDYTVLPVIVNDGEILKVRSADWPMKSSFDAVILSMEPYEYHKCSAVEHVVPGFYTYDGKTTHKNEEVADVHKMWEDDGCSFMVSKYVGCHVLMISPEEAFNGLAIVTISPTSVKRVGAYVSLELQRQRRLQPWQAVTRFGLAPTAVRGRGGKMFHPWEVKFVEAFDLEAFNKKAEA